MYANVTGGSKLKGKQRLYIAYGSNLNLEQDVYKRQAQRRRRIFLVADFGGLTAPKILFEQERLLGDPAEGQGQGKGVTTAAGNSSADSGGSRVCLLYTSRRS